MDTQTPQGINIKQIIDSALRRKALIICCILLGLTLGLTAYLFQPKTYEGTALLSYQQQSINPNQMSPDDQEHLQDIVSTLTEIVTSRTNLEKIISKENLYSTQLENAPMEDVIIAMRKKITTTPSRRGDTFIVTYESTDPSKVARVTNALASGFIEENLKYREERATETSTYTEDELAMAKEILDKKEAIMRDYTLKHYNEMPERLGVNMTRLNSLQEQYQGRQESIRDLERTRILIRDQIEVRKQVLSGTVKATSGEPTVEVESDQAQLARLRNTLNEAQERYKDKHPKIISLKRKITNLEKRLISNPISESREDGHTNRADQNFDATLFELENEIKGISLSIKRLDKERADIQKLIKQYEKWIGATPVREAEWSSLTREHGELRRHYDFLVSQNLQAESALNLEKKQKGSQFKIVDTAKTPTKPTHPEFVKLMSIALLGGIGLAAVLIAGLEFLDTSYRDPEALAQSFGIEVICSIPHIPLKKEIQKERIFAAFGAFFFITWLITLSIAMSYFWKKGMIVL